MVDAATAATKRALRREVDAALRARPPADVAADSARLCAHLPPAHWFRGARAVAAFLSMPHEVQTLPALRAAFAGGASVFVPRVTGPRAGDMAFLRLAGLDELGRLPLDRWGIPTPGEEYVDGGGSDGGARRRPALDAASVDLVLVPGVAFDRAGARLGHGKGYYDAFMAGLPRRHVAADQRGASVRPLLLGLAFDCQLLRVGDIPMAAHDVRVDMLATPGGLIDCRELRRELESRI